MDDTDLDSDLCFALSAFGSFGLTFMTCTSCEFDRGGAADAVTACIASRSLIEESTTMSSPMSPVTCKMGVLDLPKMVSGGSCVSILSFFIVSEGFAIAGAAFVVFGGGGICTHGHASVDEDEGEAGGADAGTAPVAFLEAGPVCSADADLLDGGTYPAAFGGGL